MVVAFRALRQLRSEAFWANEGVCQVDEQEQRHAATENIVDEHFAVLALKNVTGFDVGEGKGEKQNPDPENDDIHRVCSLCLLLYFVPLMERFAIP
jgi:hypothetical protein